MRDTGSHDLSSGVTVLRKDDIVLCKVNGAHYLHMVVAVNGSRYLIGNNRGHQNGWIGPNGVFGICTRVEK